MGQRLNIEILDKEGKCLPNAYYHWAAYTLSSLNLTDLILHECREATLDLNEAVRLLSYTGARVTEQDLKERRAKGGETINDAILSHGFAKSRNDGLIAVSEKGIEDTRNWAEGTIKIKPEAKTFEMNCLYQIDDLSEFGKERIDSAVSLDEIDSLETVTFDKIHYLMVEIKKAENKSGLFKVKETYYSSIY